MLYKIIFFWKKINIIHVAHSTYDTFKYLTIFPKKIVAVSNAVSKNHMSFFGLSSNRVSVVFNGLKDQTSGKSIFPRESDGTIRILLPASICPVKQQTILAQALKGKLKSNVHIYFAGIGPDLHALQEIIANDSNMHTLGLINMYESLPDYDYIMLFSKKEGLPTVFLEGCMYGKPIITNNIPPIHDIVIDKYNGYIYNSMDNLIDGLSDLPLSSDKEYLKLSNNARKVYLEKFTVDKMIEGYIKVIYCD